MIGFNSNLDIFGIDYQKIKSEDEIDIYVNHKYYKKCGHFDEYTWETKGELNEKLHRMEERL